MPTVVAGWTSLVVEYADRLALPTERLLTAAGLQRSWLARPDRRVPGAADDALWTAVEREVGPGAHGLRVSRDLMSAARLGAFGFLARSSPSLGAALGAAQRYHRLIKEDSRFEVRATGGGLLIVENPAAARGPWPAAIAEAAIANHVLLGRAWTGHDWAPTEVRFQHRAPAYAREYEELFRCPVRFEQADNALLVADELFDLPLATAEPELVDYFRALAEDQLRALHRSPRFADRVERAIAACLAAGEVDSQRVARLLGLSVRSLQRRLGAEGVHFRDLVDAARRARALELLTDPRLGLAEVAEELGFSDARAFRRAFRRWTGLSPSHFRAGQPR